MNIDNPARRKDLFKYIIYLLIVSAFLGPYFTPPSTIGPEGIIRIDQILLVLVILTTILYTMPIVRLDLNLFTLSILGISIVIFLSYVVGVVYFSFSSRLGDTFDILIWFSYFTFATFLIGAFTMENIRQSVYFLFLGVFAVSLLGLLQITGLWTSFDILQLLYAGKYESLGRVDSVEINPNIYAQLLMVPILSVCAYLVRISMGCNSVVEKYLENPKQISILYFILILSIANLYYTYSRTILVATIIGFALLALIFMGVSNNRQKTFYITLSLGAAVGILLVVLTQFGIIRPWRYASLANLSEDTSLLTRLGRWQRALPIIADSILIGHGPSKEKLLSHGITHIDSGVLEWLYRYGIVGLVFATMAWFALIRYGLFITFQELGYEQYPLVWSFSVGILVYSLVLPVVWIFQPVMRYRRPFMIYLISATLVISYYKWIERNSDRSLSCDSDSP